MRTKKNWLALLLAALALVLLSGCTQPKQVDTRIVPDVADLVKEITPDQDVVTNDAMLDRGTAAVVTYLIRNPTRPNTASYEETGVLSEKMRQESQTEKYNARSSPMYAGTVEMSRLYLFPGDISKDEVAREISGKLRQMDLELYKDSTHQFVTDSYFTYTYQYAVSVRQVYGDRDTAWVVGIGISQTAKEEHKT